MKRGHTVIGFTEAELGFFLVLVVLGTVVTSAEPRSLDVVDKIRFDSVVHDLSIARDSLNKLKSDIIPSCRETGLAADLLFSASITARNQFIINNKLMTLSDIHRVYQEQLQRATAAGCIHEVAVTYATGVTVPDLWAGLMGLRRTFRTTMSR